MDLFENNISTEEFDEITCEYLADLKNANLEEERARKREEFDQFRMAQMMSSRSELRRLGIIEQNGEVTGILITRKEADMIARLMCLMAISE